MRYAPDSNFPIVVIHFNQHYASLVAPPWCSTCFNGLGTDTSGRRRYNGSTDDWGFVTALL
ncbi:hypothetical protein BITS_1650 [Bifidobacterium tsurumiense]|uniref:Uncharacterized protein n=1 Tax=Bifidobacterium tsurumiense TaxID=356829 RepID=A0A087EBG4_9BIFI|nr:hypothetical protein BITS_1650 [Bifidobacterium tsurumiense]